MALRMMNRISQPVLLCGKFITADVRSVYRYGAIERGTVVRNGVKVKVRRPVTSRGCWITV